MSLKKINFNIQFIYKSLGYEYPFLFIDKILDFKINDRLIALKNVTNNEFFIQGHFRKEKIFPGVLMIESISQACCIFLYIQIYDLKLNKKYYLVSVKNVKFKSIVIPGDQMIITINLKRKMKNFFIFYGFIKVSKVIVCQATILCVEK